MKISNFDTAKKVFIIAELSANHSGSLQTALATIKAAARAGADAIKLQTYTPDSLTLNCAKEDFMAGFGTGEIYMSSTRRLSRPTSGTSSFLKRRGQRGLSAFLAHFARRMRTF